jgi:microcin C transport system substrate-binding protein
MGGMACGFVVAVALSAAAVPAWPRPAAAAGPAHGLSIHGDLRYPPGFPHFAYVNPAAPKGGNVRLAATGTFDNLNPFILKGVPPQGIGTTFETLLVTRPTAVVRVRVDRETIDAADRSWVFRMRAAHDRSPIAAEDAV